MRQLVLIMGMLAWAVSARAHPHVFIDVTLAFQTDETGQLTAVEVIWEYDDFYSLLLLEDRGLDPDGDGQLTAAERAALIGFDLADWPDWFEGGLFLSNSEGRIEPGVPTPLDLELLDGRLRTRHIRPITPVAVADLVIRAYDPSYYAALTLKAVEGLPDSCTHHLIQHDPDEAAAQTESQVGDGGEAAFEEVQVGIFYADTLEVSCAGS